MANFGPFVSAVIVFPMFNNPVSTGLPTTTKPFANCIYPITRPPVEASRDDIGPRGRRTAGERQANGRRTAGGRQADGGGNSMTNKQRINSVDVDVRPSRDFADVLTPSEANRLAFQTVCGC